MVPSPRGRRCPVERMRGAEERLDGEVKLIIVKVINTFKHDSRAFIEQRLIDSLMGLCRTDVTGFQAYIHTDLIDKFVDWLNENNPEKNASGGDISWEAIALDTEALLDFKESDNLPPLVIGRIKIGYVRGSEHQAFYQNFLKQAFGSRFVRMK